MSPKHPTARPAGPGPASPQAALLWSLREGWGLVSAQWIPVGGPRAAVTCGRRLRHAEIDWSPLGVPGDSASLDPGATWRPDRRRSPRAAAGLHAELWARPERPHSATPNGGGDPTEPGFLRLVGDACRLPSPEDALRAAEKLDALRPTTAPATSAAGTLADAGWAHDLRNRLTHALLWIERWRAEGATVAGAALDEVVESLKLAHETCRDRLGGAASRREPYDLRPLVLRATRCAAELFGGADARSARVLVRCPGSIETDAEAPLLSRAIENLTLNALEAYDVSDGVNTERPAVRVDVREREDGVSLTIADTGRGMGPAELHAFRTPGHSGRAAEGGTGYGTASLFECLEGMRAELRLETTPGTGTTVEIRLPRRKTAMGESLAWSPWASDREQTEILENVRRGLARKVRIPRGATGPLVERLREACEALGVPLELTSCQPSRDTSPTPDSRERIPEQRARTTQERERLMPEHAPNY